MRAVVVAALEMAEVREPEDLQAEGTDQQTQTVLLERLTLVAAVVAAV
jgi:hypothetical protein